MSEMLMKWEDLLPGDKVKFTKESQLEYGMESWFTTKVMTIKKVVKYIDYIIIYTDNYCFSIDMFGNDFFVKYFKLFDVVELCEDN